MTWQPNPMHPHTHKVLKTIAAAGSEGIRRPALNEALPSDVGQVSKRLANLVTLGYVLKHGKYHEARFVATSKQPPEATDEADAEELLRAEVVAKTPKGVPAGVPNSVFQLGQLCAAEPAAAAPARVAAHAAAPAPCSSRRVNDAFIDLADGGYWVPRFDDKPAPNSAGPWRDAPKPPAPPAPARAPAVPRFELHSDGALLIDPAGDGTEPITFTPTVTRQLFRWLDQLGGLQLSRLVAAGTEATS